MTCRPAPPRPPRLRLGSLLLALATVALAGCSGETPGEAPAAPPPAAGQPTVELVPGGPDGGDRLLFESGGREVSARLVRASGPGPRPLVVLLHGRAGLPYYGERLEGLARRLADAGFAALVPDYFAATGDRAPPEVDDARFRAWRWALADALAAGATLTEVDAERMGVAGFSLGGYLALTEAAGNPAIRAVAASYAGTSAYFPLELERYPPLLVLHATGDPVVPVERARDLVRTVRAAGGEVESEFYPARAHVLEGEAWESSVDRIVRFFERTLGSTPTTDPALAGTEDAREEEVVGER